MLSRNEKRVHIILTITVDMYLYLVSTPAQPWQVHDTTLATIITSLFTILFTNGSQTNVDIAAQKLKVNLAYCREVRFASFLSGGCTTMSVINAPERKLAKFTSVYWHKVDITEGASARFWIWKLNFWPYVQLGGLMEKMGRI